jgi:hypothetical protein
MSTSSVWAALHAEVQALKGEFGPPGSVRHEDHADAVGTAQARLAAKLLDGLEERVRAAAQEGRRELSLLEFRGNDVFDDGFFYLYLILGPKPPTGGWRRSPEVTPMVQSLNHSLAPFRVRHDWRRGTDHNSLVLEW